MNAKKWYQSLTIQIAIVSSIAGILPLVVDLVKVLAPDAVTVVAAIVVFLLGITAVVRRFLLDPENPPASISK